MGHCVTPVCSSLGKKKAFRVRAWLSISFPTALDREVGAVKLLSALDLLLNGGHVGRAGDNIRRVGVGRCPGHAVLVARLQSVGPSSVFVFASFLGDLVC